MCDGDPPEFRPRSRPTSETRPAPGRRTPVSRSLSDRRLDRRADSVPYPRTSSQASRESLTSVGSLDWDTNISAISLTYGYIYGRDRLTDSDSSGRLLSVTNTCTVKQGEPLPESESDDSDSDIFSTPSVSPQKPSPRPLKTFPKDEGLGPFLRHKIRERLSQESDNDVFIDEVAPQADPLATMTAPEALNHRAKVLEFIDTADEDLLPIVFNDIPLEQVREAAQRAERTKQSLNASVAYLKINDNAFFQGHLTADTARVKRALPPFIRDAYKHIKDMTEQQAANDAVVAAAARDDAAGAAAAATAAFKVKTDRVERLIDPYINRATALINTYREVEENPTPTDRDVDLETTELATHNKEAEECIRDLDNLIKEALVASMTPEVTRIELSIQRLKQRKNDANRSNMELRKDRGLHGRLGGSKSQLVDIKPPIFSGVQTGGKHDFYTFKSEFADYAQAKSLSLEQQAGVIVKACLEGAAKTLVKHLVNIEEIWRVLKRAYGDPGFLLDAKMEEVKKLGPCKGDPEKRREWAIDAHSKLQRVFEIATEHGLEAELHHSSIVGIVKKHLPSDNVKEFMEIVKDVQTEERTEVKKPRLFALFLTYIENLIDAETLNIRVNAMMGVEAEANKPNPMRPSKPPDPRPQTGRHTRSGRTYQNSQNSGQCHQCCPAQGQPAPPTPPPPAGGQYQHQPAPTQGGFNKRSRKDNTMKKYSSGVAQGGTHANQGQRAQGTQGTFCKKCKEEHEFLFNCRNFQSKDMEARHDLAQFLHVCHRCLRLDSQVSLTSRGKWWSKHQPGCQTGFPCTTGHCSTKDVSRQKHIIMCQTHFQENQNEIRNFVASLDPTKIIPNLRFFFMAPTICRMDDHTLTTGVEGEEVLPAIYMVQTIKGQGNVPLLVFYDSGCTGASISSRAHSVLDTTVVREGPTTLNVAGGRTINVEYGDERFQLPIHGSDDVATLVALRLDEVTNTFPCWRLQAAFEDVSNDYYSKFPQGDDLPQVDDKVGGSGVDIMVGIRYNQFFPVLNHMLPGGLAIYTAKIESMSGNQGILGGCHKSWAEASERALFMTPRAYFSSEFRAYRAQSNALDFRITLGLVESVETYDTDRGNNFASSPEPSEECASSLDQRTDCGKNFASSPAHGSNFASSPSRMPDNILFSDQTQKIEKSSEIFFSFSCEKRHCDRHQGEDWVCPPQWEADARMYTVIQDERRFWESENTGTEADYRCVACRNCAKCRDADQTEKVSLQQEVEQSLLEKTLSYDPVNKIVSASLPFMEDPSVALKPNRHIAEKVFESQMRLINRNPGMREDVIRAHNKLRDKGFVVPMSELSEQDAAEFSVLPGDGVFIPWQIQYKEASKSTPARLVFNGSSTTGTGKSLNSILAKGDNTLAKILDVMIRFRAGAVGMTADVKMAYNGIRLKPQYFKYQKYLWKEDLNPEHVHLVMVIVTLIYGIKPSGQQMIAAFAMLADFCAEHFPQHYDGAEALKKSAYVDDLVHAVRCLVDAHRVAKSISFTLALGSMSVKCFTFTGQTPSDVVSNDGVHVGVLGYMWDPLKDILRLDVKQLYFGKPRRGKLPPPVQGDIKEALKGSFTRRNLLGKVAGVYDQLGLVTPITAKLKLDLHELTDLKLDWDDLAPPRLLDTWVENLKIIAQLNDIEFRRAVVHPDAVDDQFELIASSDASSKIAIASIHAVSKLKDGTSHVQLMVAKSKLTKGASIPRAELKAALLGAVLAQVVKKNVLQFFQGITYVTDSTICLYWIHQDYRPLQVAVRNAVIQIRRFSLPEQWFHVDSANNIADLGTRPATLEEIGLDSDWQNGRPWMRTPRVDWPLRSLDQLILTPEQKTAAAKELKAPDVGGHVLSHMVDKVGQRYAFSKYVYDPCRLSWSTVLKVICCLFRVLDKAKKRVPDGRKDGIYSDSELDRARDYYFKKGTLEVQQFSKPRDFKDVTTLKGKILYYNGRILDNREMNAMENTMFDLTPLSFVRPVLDRYSPIAYSLMVHCHSRIVLHRSTIATLRESYNHAYIIGGRDLAAEVRESCVQCRRYRRQLLEVEHGGVHKSRLTVAPAFWTAQCDLMGPFLAWCEHNHRSSVKVWGLVFKCPSTAAISVHAMSSYNTSSFVNAYCRFASVRGHPTKLYIDEGGQLMKGVQEMEYSMANLERTMDAQYKVGIEYETCPVQAHAAHGIVERSIKEVKRFYRELFSDAKLDSLGFETAFLWISNEMNNLPICLGSKYKDLSHLDLISPNRLLLGRNNRRSPVGPVLIDQPSRIMKQLEDLYEAWWATWKTEKLIDYVPQPRRWSKTTYVPQRGDIVVFPREEIKAIMGETPWRIGRITHTDIGKDGKVRVAIIEYRNPKEKVFRQTRRSVRTLAVLHKEGNLELLERLNEASKVANLHFIRTEPELHYLGNTAKA